MTRRRAARRAPNPPRRPRRRPPEWINDDAPYVVDEEAADAEIAATIDAAADTEAARVLKDRSRNWVVHLALRCAHATRPDRDERIKLWIAERIKEWGRHLAELRKNRARSIELAKLRDQVAAARFPADDLVVPVESLHVRLPGRRHVRIPRYPVGPRVNKVRAELRANHYSDRGVLPPVEWDWLEEAEKCLTDEQLALAWEIAGENEGDGARRRVLGTGVGSVERAQTAALTAIRNLRARAMRARARAMRAPARIA